MKSFFLSFLFLFFIVQLQAQQVRGRIIDGNSGSGIPFASVTITGSTLATVTNENGYFIIKVEKLPTVLKISHVSYTNVEATITDAANLIELKLNPATISLEQVTIDPFRGQKILIAALEKAQRFANQNFYANAFYRQLTELNGKPSQIYELFYDLRWNTQRVQGWAAKQSRYAELNDQIAFSLNNQSYLTFSYSGYLLPEQSGKFINLKNIKEYDISIVKYIDQANQTIAIVSCKYKNKKKNQYYVNSTYYIGMDDYNVYRVENTVYNLPIRFTEASAKTPPVVTTVATFNTNQQATVSILESISTKMTLNLLVQGKELTSTINSLLTVYNLNNDLRRQQFESLNRNTKDRNVIESIKYDPIFWQNNPIVMQTTLEDSFIKMMESKSAFGTMTNP